MELEPFSDVKLVFFLYYLAINKLIKDETTNFFLI